jgi:hypothetical protein
MNNQPRKFFECPKCRGKCVWRHGVHFDHEVRCVKGCGAFDPHELWEREEAERLKFNSSQE